MPAEEKNESVVSEYLEGYFGGELNESTSDEDIMEAFDELLETADAVEAYIQEFIGTGDSIMRGAALPTNKEPNGAEMQRRAKIRKFKKKWGKSFPEIR